MAASLIELTLVCYSLNKDRKVKKGEVKWGKCLVFDFYTTPKLFTYKQEIHFATGYELKDITLKKVSKYIEIVYKNN